MKVKAECPLCHGRGVILDADPCAPAKLCSCSTVPRGEAVGGVPPRYSGVTMESFWEWWKTHGSNASDARVREKLKEARETMENEMTRVALKIDEQSKIAGILDKCRGKNEGGGNWKSIRPAQEPNGFGGLKIWIQKDSANKVVCWIDGPPGSGRSSLAAAVLSDWCRHRQKPGLFVSVRTFSQELKDTYYDTRSWQNADFKSERDRTAPLETAPCLVLDDFDRMDSDVRVVRAFAQLLDHRWSQKLPTIITASKWTETLAAGGDTYAITKLEDDSTMQRLLQACRVTLVPTLLFLLPDKK